jgi:predicted RNase H-like nuclease (RuvC/YqgF family)
LNCPQKCGESNLSQEEIYQKYARIWKFKEKAKDIERKKWVAKGEIDGLISERERIERNIQHFVNTTKEFEIRDKRFAKVRARELCEKYE